MSKSSIKCGLIQKQVDKLIQDGCVIEINIKDCTYTDLLAKAIVTEKGLLWCGVFPQDQHNCHLTRISKVTILDSDGVFLIGQKTRIVPIDRSFRIAAAEMFERWNAWLIDLTHKNNFDQFFEAQVQLW
jgi:hypothetical protein